MPIYHHLPVKEVLKELDTSSSGLTQKEAEERLKKHGLNKLPEKKPPSALEIFASQFKSPLILILLAAAIITLLFQHFSDTITIMLAVLVNAMVGFIQERKAETSLQALKKAVTRKAKVIRGGYEMEINAEGLVVGDLLILQSGDSVPADARLLVTRDLEVNEALLTGESFPVEKNIKTLKEETTLADRKNMVHMGTVVTQGSGRAVVCAVGARTEIGKIAGLLEESLDLSTPLQERIAKFSKTLGVIILVLCLLIFFGGVIEGAPLVDMFITSVAVAVAAIPEGLPISLTVILAVGTQRILSEKALVRKLIAAETLGSTQIICTDKTGTLTEGEMRVVEIITPEGNSHSTAKGIKQDGWAEVALAMRIAALCNNAFIENPHEALQNWRVRGTPTEKALILTATEAGFHKEELEKEFPRIDEVPFDSSRKHFMTLHKTDGRRKNTVFMVGAPEVILDRVSFIEKQGGPVKLSAARRGELEKGYREMGARGLRTLALAYKEVEETNLKEVDMGARFVLVAFFGIKDPLRPEAREVLETCRRAGVKPVIITGDHELTARAIAEEAGLKVNAESVLNGEDLRRMSDEELQKRVKQIIVYARVSPEDKPRIVRAWKEEGMSVAMIGDGVNDAPAIKIADIGVALGSGTDVAKQASDIILLDDNFKTIVSAVRQGRVIFENFRKVVLYSLSSAFSEVVLVGGSVILGLPLPILPAQILWVNLVEDSLPNFALALEPEEKEVMDDPPRPRAASILDTEMKILIFIIGLITDLILFGLFLYIFRRTGGDLDYTRSFLFAALGVDSLFYVFACRSLRFNVWRKNPFSNRFLLVSVVVGGIALFGGIYLPVFQTLLRTQPLAPFDLGLVISLGAFGMILIELVKWVFIVRKKHPS